MSNLERPAATPDETRAGAPSAETIRVAGLVSEAEIRVDRWGVPHLRAGSAADGFFVQGFNAARDRLWQIDLWRKRGLGLLSGDFGPGYLEQDAAARAFLFRGDMAAEWVAYAPDTRDICESFVSGINAYIALTEDEPARLPEEFAQMGTAPARWQAEDVLRIRSHALTRNALSEIMRACLMTGISAESDLLRKNLEPLVRPGNAGEADPAVFTPRILDVFRLATAPVTFSPERLAATVAEAGKWRKVTPLAEVVADADWTGSNHWAIAGSHSATGRAIMATDPHRTHGLPSLRCAVHLKTPEFDVIGAGEPSAPGISLGHNGTIAFSQTIFSADQEDIYLYETDPENPDRYLCDGEWTDMELVEESFPLRDGAPETRVLRFTRHGPVLWQDPARNLVFALRSVWFEPGSAAYLAGLSSMRATTLDGFRAAIARFGTPSLNHLYADTSGTIAWMPYGMIPVRHNWDGLLPVPGDGRFEWDGFVSLDTMPLTVNPTCGYVYSANEANLPEDWDHEANRVGFEWLEASRARRIADVLGSEAPGSHGIAQSIALQTDVMTEPGLRLRALLAPLSAEGATGEALALIAGWDGMATAGSAGAALCEYWYARHLKPALFALFVPDPSLRPLMEPGDVEGILKALETPGAAFGEAPEAARDALLLETLTAAHAALVETLGKDTAEWRWGDLHHGFFEHPLGPVAGDEWRKSHDIGPLAKGGSASTVMHAAYRTTDFRVTTGASVRIIMDVGNWDESVFINAPGQSGDRRSPHYDDLAPQWARGEYVPFLYSDAAVEEATAQVIRLLPASGN
ncbi:MAG: penicillin acylase family protein [Rhodobacteraceae bacterium]|nr:penicillin acylase family protein [Paracoccaceae bacterium]